MEVGETPEEGVLQEVLKRRYWNITPNHGTNGYQWVILKGAEETMPSCPLGLSSCLVYQNALYSPLQLATSVPRLLEPKTANLLMTFAVAANVLRTSHSHVSLTQ